MSMSMSYGEAVEGEPLERGGSSARFNGEGGVRKEWWWQAGPVDSCCCCCSLRAGVAILATVDLLYKGIWVTFYLTPAVNKIAHDQLLPDMEAEYDRECTGVEAQSADCLEQEQLIEQIKVDIELMDHMPTVFYIQGIIAIIAGIAGLVAVFKSSALAAKVYLWTWLPRFVALTVTQWVQYAKNKEYGLDPNLTLVLFMECVSLLFIVYYVKVLWSYQERLNRSSSSSRTAEGAQLRDGLDGV